MKTMDRIIETFPTFWHLWLVGAVLLFITIGFLAKFVFPALRLERDLGRSIKELERIKKEADEAGGPVIDLKGIADGLKGNLELEHSWSEYAETLHKEEEVDPSGQKRTVRWRATALAETFFSENAIVGTPLKTEFYKHLPGILTGLGIIGTFLGLIMGLSSFDVADPAKAQLELKILINAVGHAFIVSAIAISLAMLFTYIEKSLVSGRYRQVTKLRETIDSLFDAGVGEAYLERIVKASETQATQAAHIKDALVVELREILTTLTEKQMEAYSRQTSQVVQAQAEHSVRMSADVGKAIAEHLGGPIADIATAVKGVSANQGEAVNKMLTDVLAAFSAQMRDMFGGQISGMSDLLKETSEAMRASAEKFARLASDMDAAGKGAVDAMGERLTTAITAMEARQHLLNKQMGEFVGQIRGMVAESQTESARKLQESLSAVGEQVAGVVAELRQQAEQSAELQGRRQERFEEATGRAVATLSANMEGLLAQSVETTRSLQDTVARLSNATHEAITGMNQGAETLYLAASEFATAGKGVSATMAASTEAVGNIRAASTTLTAATSAAKDVLVDYGRTRESFSAMVSELKSVTESARRDAAMTSEIIARIEAASQKLGQAQRQSEDYLQGINNVLAHAHESFFKNVEQTMREGNRQFQHELRTAVDMVSAAVRDLGDTLEDVPGRRS